MPWSKGLAQAAVIRIGVKGGLGFRGLGFRVLGVQGSGFRV